ncbi:MAG: phage tail assembly protein [Lachnospiraceae bacterium]
MEKKELEVIDDQAVNGTDMDAQDGDNAENKYIVTFAKPFVFEGKSYEKIDLSGLEDLAARDMIAVNKIMERSGTINMLPEMSLEYACLISGKATKLPVEFFQALPPKEAIKVKNKVTSFFFSEG